ncbi:porin family protein [Bacteroides reticulotermitis]|uniref:Outer membrane protein beta-barrel domain-containing protein n=2 Tax=Bacteroides reticulotermitis TaxID=1133319 RepID=W4UTF3_9BACE|nr:porin family protein [Bacteroides reticulotermitis]GAE84221.1 hypothetical protein JCM10512_2550 [Bacteroides reticulotermitis JCM 10512]
MKRKLVFIFFTLLTVMASAQVTWNAKVGLNLSNFTGKDTGDAKFKLGYRMGVGLDYAFNETWSLQPSLLLSAKGAKFDFGDSDQTLTAAYLELPVYVAGHWALSDKFSLVANAGPYVAYGLFGKNKMSEGGITVSSNTFGDGGLNRLDAGVGLGVGLDFGKFIIGLEYQQG